MIKPNAKFFAIGQQVRYIVRFGSMEYDAVVVGIGDRELTIRNVGAKDNVSIIYHTMQAVIGNTIIAKGAVHSKSKSPDIVGLAEAAELLGWKKQHLYSYIKRGVFPPPLQTLASGPIWLQSQIQDYKDSRA